MYKKILIILLVFSPLIYTIFIGYPVLPQKDYELKKLSNPGISVSKRCFQVGDENTFINCFKSSEKIKNLNVFSETNNKLKKISSIFSLVFTLSLVIFLIAALVLILI